MFCGSAKLGLILLSAGAALLCSILIPSVYVTLLLSLALLGAGVLLLRKR